LTFDEVFELGYLERVHGINGELLLIMDVDSPSDYSKLGSVFLDIKGKLIPFLVQKQKAFKTTQLLLKFEDIDDEESAADLVGAGAYMPLHALPPLADDKYYFHELIGMQVIDEELGAVGLVTGVLETPQQFLLQFDHQSHEVLCPMHDDILVQVDRAAKIIRVRLPGGLLEVYTS